MMPLLEAKGLGFGYSANNYIFKDFDLSLNAGEIIGIMGPSGCGKTTLCYTLSGIIPHIYNGFLTGQVLLLEKDIKYMCLGEIAVKIGIVFQEPEQQFFSPVLEENLAFGPENLCVERAEIGKRMDDILELTGLNAYRYASPHKLSGGQAQLAALACILTMQPQVLILDEVSSQLDSEGVELIQNLVANLKDMGKGVIMVDHNQERLALADKIISWQQGKWGILK